MITPTTLPTFPGCPTFGFGAQPDLLVRHIQREGGYESSNRQWLHPLLKFEGTPLGPRPQADIETLLRFWRAIGGTSTRFRFKDWSDYKSCGLDEEPSAIDQPLQLVSGSPGGYQMIKQYVVVLAPLDLTEDRIITRPKGDTILVANEAQQVQASSTYTVEEDTGLIVPGPGFVGTPTSWGGEFYVKCRFDGPFRVEIVNHEIQDLQVTICEVREGA